MKPQRTLTLDARTPTRRNVWNAWNAILAPAMCLLSGLAVSTCSAAAPATPPSDHMLQLSPKQLQAMGVIVAPVSAAAARLGPYAGTVGLPPAKLRRVAAPWAGLVAQLQVSEGDTVKAGQVLATLVSPDALAQANAARAARSQQSQSQQALQRDEALYGEGLIPRARLEATRNLARQDELAAQSRQAAAQSPDVRWDGARLHLLSPIHGVVLGRTVALGERVDTGAPLLVIGQPGAWLIDLRVPVNDAARMQVGQPVSLGDASQAPRARVAVVGLGVDANSQTVLVRAQLPADASHGLPPLRWGQAVEARVHEVQPGQAEVVGLPDTAIVDWRGQAAVWVQGGVGRFQLHTVQQAQRLAGQSTVRGLPANARVVTRGAVALKAMLEARP